MARWPDGLAIALDLAWITPAALAMLVALWPLTRPVARADGPPAVVGATA